MGQLYIISLTKGQKPQGQNKLSTALMDNLRHTCVGLDES